MNKKSRPILKTVSLLLVQAFLLQEISFAAPEIKPVDIPFLQPSLISFKLPQSVAAIEDVYKTQGKTLILIQDAHTNESAQANLAKSLDIILQKEKIKYVFLEAGTGDDSLSFLRDKAPLEKRKRVAASFMKQGELSGSEYLDLTSDLPFTLWGVEDKALYWESIEVYGEVVKGRAKFQDYLKKAETTVQTLKLRIYNPLLLSFDKKRESYLKEEISLTDYFDILAKEAEKKEIALKKYPHLKTLINVRDKEKAIDFKAATKEQIKAFEALSQEDVEILREAAKTTSYAPFKVSSQEHREEKAFYALLEEKIKDFTKYPELSKYLSYLKAAKKIDARKLLEEEKLLENDVVVSFMQTQDEKDLYRASENVRSLKRLLDLTLSPDEFESYKLDPRGYDITFITGFLNRKIMDLRSLYERVVFLEEGYEDFVTKAEKFYELTYQRDKAFLRNVLQKMNEEGQDKAVLITGGYHSPNLKALLKDQNVSYVCVTPQVLHETNLKRYEKILLTRAQAAQSVIASPKGAKQSISQDTIAIVPTKEVKGPFDAVINRLSEEPVVFQMGNKLVVEGNKPSAPLASAIKRGGLLNAGKAPAFGARLAENEFVKELEETSPGTLSGFYNVKKPASTHQVIQAIRALKDGHKILSIADIVPDQSIKAIDVYDLNHLIKQDTNVFVTFRVSVSGELHPALQRLNEQVSTKSTEDLAKISSVVVEGYRLNAKDLLKKAQDESTTLGNIVEQELKQRAPYHLTPVFDIQSGLREDKNYEVKESLAVTGSEIVIQSLSGARLAAVEGTIDWIESKDESFEESPFAAAYIDTGKTDRTPVSGGAPASSIGKLLDLARAMNPEAFRPTGKKITDFLKEGRIVSHITAGNHSRVVEFKDKNGRHLAVLIPYLLNGGKLEPGDEDERGIVQRILQMKTPDDYLIEKVVYFISIFLAAIDNYEIVNPDGTDPEFLSNMLSPEEKKLQKKFSDELLGILFQVWQAAGKYREASREDDETKFQETLKEFKGAVSQLENKLNEGWLFLPLPFLSKTPTSMDLAEALSSNALDDLQKLQVITKVYALVRRLHDEKGIVHRDIKPSNVWVDFTDPLDVKVQLIDLGISSRNLAAPSSAEAVKSSHHLMLWTETGLGRPAGTRQYFKNQQDYSPEKEGPVDPARDGWAVRETSKEILIKSSTPLARSIFNLISNDENSLDEIIAQAAAAIEKPFFSAEEKRNILMVRAGQSGLKERVKELADMTAEEINNIGARLASESSSGSLDDQLKKEAVALILGYYLGSQQLSPQNLKDLKKEYPDLAEQFSDTKRKATKKKMAGIREKYKHVQNLTEYEEFDLAPFDLVRPIYYDLKSTTYEADIRKLLEDQDSVYWSHLPEEGGEFISKKEVISRLKALERTVVRVKAEIIAKYIGVGDAKDYLSDPAHKDPEALTDILGAIYVKGSYVWGSEQIPPEDQDITVVLKGIHANVFAVLDPIDVTQASLFPGGQQSWTSISKIDITVIGSNYLVSPTGAIQKRKYKPRIASEIVNLRHTAVPLVGYNYTPLPISSRNVTVKALDLYDAAKGMLNVNRLRRAIARLINAAYMLNVAIKILNREDADAATIQKVDIKLGDLFKPLGNFLNMTNKDRGVVISEPVLESELKKLIEGNINKVALKKDEIANLIEKKMHDEMAKEITAIFFPESIKTDGARLAKNFGWPKDSLLEEFRGHDISKDLYSRYKREKIQAAKQADRLITAFGQELGQARNRAQSVYPFWKIWRRGERTRVFQQIDTFDEEKNRLQLELQEKRYDTYLGDEELVDLISRIETARENVREFVGVGSSGARLAQLVTLKNGATEPDVLVTVTMMSLQRLIQTNPIAFYELVMKARDPNHQFFGNTGEVLRRLALVQPNGTLHDSIRNIVVSAADGEGLGMGLTSPVKPGTEPTTPVRPTEIKSEGPKNQEDIENTTKNPHPEWVMGGNPQAIVDQEKRGQQQLAGSQFLPIEGTSNESEWTAIGVTLGKPKEGDPLFRHVTLPAGWKIVPTDHDMWSNLVDAEGHIRAGIFYKAAFYDRRASVSLVKDSSGARLADVANLIGRLENDDKFVRRQAALALAQHSEDPTYYHDVLKAIPALIRVLNDEDLLVKRYAVWALGKIGPAAKEAIPALMNIKIDDVKWAIQNIESGMPRAEDRDARLKIAAALKSLNEFEKEARKINLNIPSLKVHKAIAKNDLKSAIREINKIIDLVLDYESVPASPDTLTIRLRLEEAKGHLSDALALESGARLAEISISDARGFLHKALIDGLISFHTNAQREEARAAGRDVSRLTTLEDFENLVWEVGRVSISSSERFFKNARLRGFITFDTRAEKEDAVSRAIGTNLRLAITAEELQEIVSATGKKSISNVNQFLTEARRRGLIAFDTRAEREDAQSRAIGAYPRPATTAEDLRELAWGMGKVSIPNARIFLREAGQRGLIHLRTNAEREDLRAQGHDVANLTTEEDFRNLIFDYKGARLAEGAVLLKDLSLTISNAATGFFANNENKGTFSVYLSVREKEGEEERLKGISLTASSNQPETILEDLKKQLQRPEEQVAGYSINPNLAGQPELKVTIALQSAPAAARLAAEQAIDRAIQKAAFEKKAEALVLLRKLLMEGPAVIHRASEADRTALQEAFGLTQDNTGEGLDNILGNKISPYRSGRNITKEDSLVRAIDHNLSVITDEFRRRLGVISAEVITQNSRRALSAKAFLIELEEGRVVFERLREFLGTKSGARLALKEKTPQVSVSFPAAEKFKISDENKEALKLLIIEKIGQTGEFALLSDVGLPGIFSIVQSPANEKGQVRVDLVIKGQDAAILSLEGTRDQLRQFRAQILKKTGPKEITVQEINAYVNVYAMQSQMALAAIIEELQTDVAPDLSLGLFSKKDDAQFRTQLNLVGARLAGKFLANPQYRKHVSVYLSDVESIRQPSQRQFAEELAAKVNNVLTARLGARPGQPAYIQIGSPDDTFKGIIVKYFDPTKIRDKRELKTDSRTVHLPVGTTREGISLFEGAMDMGVASASAVGPSFDPKANVIDFEKARQERGQELQKVTDYYNTHAGARLAGVDTLVEILSYKAALNVLAKFRFVLPILKAAINPMIRAVQAMMKAVGVAA